MRIYNQTNDYACLNIIEKGPTIPTKVVEKEDVVKPQNEWTPTYIKDVQNNAKTIRIIYYALGLNEFNRVSRFETAKEIWDKL